MGLPRSIQRHGTTYKSRLRISRRAAISATPVSLCFLYYLPYHDRDHYYQNGLVPSFAIGHSARYRLRWCSRPLRSSQVVG
jgi:hypothetical protein